MHSPNLETIKMIESSIALNSGKYGKFQLWRMLPKSMMYQTFQEAISYLVESNRVEIKDGKIHWTFNENIGEEI